MTYNTSPITVTSSTFQQEVLDSALPVLVDIWAPWCGPCRVIGPIVEELAQEFEGRAIVAKLNSDDESDVASKYNVQAIPTLLIFHKGEVVDRVVGLVTKTVLTDKLNHVLNADEVAV